MLDSARRRSAQIEEALIGPSLTRQPPERVMRAIRAQEDSSEVLICILQIVAIALFATVYAISPKAFGPETRFEPVPVTLAVYAVFTALRLWLAVRGRLTPFFLGLSVVVDVAVLMITIWSFHLQYGQPPSAYLKAPTLLYVFIIICMRALRFEPRWVLLAGASAASGWLVLLAYALWGEPMSTMITRSFAEYATTNKLLIGAEIDKVISIVMVALVLALVIARARRMLIRSVAEEAAASELSRFFAPDIAASIVEAEVRLEPGTGLTRQAAVMFIDLRGFTALASTIAPTRLVQILTEYHKVVLPVVRRHNGSVITYLGDGIMITFGATRPSETCAADALHAAEQLIGDLEAWGAARRVADHAPLAAGIGITYGPVICGAIGTEGRLEYATIGDTVNKAARLQGLTKSVGAAALVTADAWRAALDQGFNPSSSFEERLCTLAGIVEPVPVVALHAASPSGLT